ncbi:hypothetical protein PG995_004805 [Apiospora arundinis]
MRDVAIIGGGLSGTYTAVKLKDMMVSSFAYLVSVRDEHAGELGHGAAGGPPEPCQQTLFPEYRRIIAVRHERASEY